MNNKTVSLIVRTKDRPKLLKKALQSISNQTYRPIEVVLVNDGGCDMDVGELRDILGDVSLNYIRLEINMGRAHAGNVGLENAKGEYIGFLDDDDELYPEHVVTLVSFLEQSDYKIAYTDAEISYRDFDPEKKKIADVSKTVLFSKYFSYEELLVGNYIPFMCALFSKEIFLTPDSRFDESFNLYEDWDLLIRIGHKYPFYHIKRVTALYNQWSRELQINQADSEQMKSMHLRVINKHREKITPDIILSMKHKKESLELELKNLTDRYRDLESGLLEGRYPSKLEELIREKDRHILQLDEMVREKDDHIWQLDEAVRGKDRHILQLNGVIGEKDSYISQLEKTIREKDNLVSQLELSLYIVKNTFGWRLLEKYRKIREKILPSAMRPGEIYDLVKKSFKVLMNEGLKVFLKRVKHWMKGIISDGKAELPVLLPLDIEKSALIHFPSKRNYSVLFLKCEWAGITNHYRVDNMIEYLKLKNIYTEVLDLCDLPTEIPYACKFDLIVIHRIPMNQLLDTFIRICKEFKAIVIFDIDDYLFEPSIIRLIEWVKHTKSTERDKLIEHIVQCRQTLEACDYFISPTDFLSNKAVDLRRKAYVLRNGFSRELLQTFSKVLGENSFLKNDNIIRIGYFSGTNTHQKDFHMIAPAISRILREYEHVNLHVCGLLELDYNFDSFMHRVEKSSFIPLEQLPYYISKFDINIAPLEIGNIFCEAKSELKYIYAGILKIPTVATPTDAFRHAIQHGKNGFLASTEEEWYVCLKTLIENSSTRKNMGEKAYIHVRNTYVPEVLADKVKVVYENIIDEVRFKNNISTHNISINFIVSDVVDNFDKYVSLLKIADLLTKNGHYVRLYFYKAIDVPSSNGSQELFYYSKSVIIQGMENILSSDVLICTDPYNSSFIAYQNRNRTANLVYLVMNENYEKIHYQWSELFKVVPYSSDYSEIANKIESIAWDMVDLKKS